MVTLVDSDLFDDQGTYSTLVVGVESNRPRVRGHYVFSTQLETISNYS
jgi:hypothetical protein